MSFDARSQSDLDQLVQVMLQLDIKQKALVICECFKTGLMTADQSQEMVQKTLARIPIQQLAEKFAEQKPEIVTKTFSNLALHTDTVHNPDGKNPTIGFTQKELDQLTDIIKSCTSDNIFDQNEKISYKTY